MLLEEQWIHATFLLSLQLLLLFFHFCFAFVRRNVLLAQKFRIIDVLLTRWSIFLIMNLSSYRSSCIMQIALFQHPHFFIFSKRLFGCLWNMHSWAHLCKPDFIIAVNIVHFGWPITYDILLLFLTLDDATLFFTSVWLEKIWIAAKLYWLWH